VIPLVALVAGLVLAVPSAAQVGAGKLGIVARDGIYTMNPDGSSLTLIRPESCLPVPCSPAPSWSPDGSLIAFQEDGQIKVMNSAGGDVRTIATPVAQPLTRQPWSPSSKELTFGSGDSLVVASTDGHVRYVTGDSSPVRAAAWSPSGSSIAYVSGTSLRVVDASGGTAKTIASETAPDLNWSPDGNRIAFTRVDGIWVVDADGSDLQHIVPPGAPLGVSNPVWSPDGTKVLFEQSDGGNFPLYDTWLVDLASRQITRLTFDISNGGTSLQPTWSPDGSWITVERDSSDKSVNRVLNADGTCARDLQGPPGEIFWQPVPDAPPLARYDCHSLRVFASTVRTGSVGVELTVTIENRGTKPLSAVRLRKMTGTDLTPTSVRATAGSCSLRPGPRLCWIGLLRSGESAQVTVRADGRRVSTGYDREDWLSTTFSARANEPLIDVDAASFQYSWFLGRCTTRTPGGGLIEGTSDAELICGRRGRDRIEPSWGKDRVRAGAGNDLIFARDTSRDVVSCGPGKDVVYVDHRDKVGRDCERVIHRG
jgi:dipeptidyl aminopeptidase/acylaminoacyl peptidase